jgi:hypothetical protein
MLLRQLLKFLVAAFFVKLIEISYYKFIWKIKKLIKKIS